MKLSGIVFFAGLIFSSYVAGELCTVSGVGVGACVTSTICSQHGGTAHSGVCSGSNVCCVNVLCGGSTGLCMQTSECTGSVEQNLCPGPSDFTCCKNIPCNSGKGKCTSQSNCNNGTIIHNVCPGPSSFICCEGGSSGGSGDKIVAAARSMVGKYPYSWGGGNDKGATTGTKESEYPYCDDTHVVGFDCSGLAKYSVFQATGKSLYHHAQTQYNDAPKRVPISEKKPGDLVFFGKSTTSIVHVAIYSGNGNMIEAPGHNSDCTGIKVREKTLRTSELIEHAARYW